MSRETNWDKVYKDTDDAGREALDEIIKKVPEYMIDFVKKYPPGTPFSTEEDFVLIVVGWKEMNGVNHVVLERPDGERINESLKGLIVSESYIEASQIQYVARMGLN